eukprot:507557-Pleurochrysis_carterae.AAC.3
MACKLALCTQVGRGRKKFRRTSKVNCVSPQESEKKLLHQLILLQFLFQGMVDGCLVRAT